MRFAAIMLVAIACWAATAPAVADTPLSLAEALAEARRSNARLPGARLDAESAAAGVEEAQGRSMPSLAFDGDVHAGAPEKYASNDARAQLVAELPIYDGGRLRAGVVTSIAAADAARAGYHQAEKELDRAVRSLFAACLEAEQEISFRRAGIERLRTYQALIETQRASGQGVASDLLKTRVRLDDGEADVAGAQLRMDEAKLELSELLGRDPEAPLELAPLPEPELPAEEIADEPWRAAPEIAQAEAATRVAAASVTAAHAERLPKISLLANVGSQPVWGNSKLALMNSGEGWGGEVVLSVNLPLWDGGVLHSRVAQAELAERAASQRLSVAERGARLEWRRALVDLRGLFREVEARARSVATARDSFLQAESLHRGGAGSALEVLDAYDAWISGSQAHAEAVLRYRLAQAALVRWGTQ
jgi:outer membrane protein